MDSTSIFYNILSSSALKPVELLLKLFLTSYLLHHLDPEKYGYIQTTISLLGGLTAFTGLGLDKVISVQLHRETSAQARRFLIRKAIAFRILMTLSFGGLASLFFHFTGSEFLLWPAFLLFASESLSGICSSIIITLFHLRALSFLRVLLLLVQIFLVVGITRMNLTWEYYLATFFVVPGGLFFCLLYLLQKKFSFLKSEALIYTPKFSNIKPAYAMDVSDYMLGKQSDAVLISSYVGASAVAIYSTAQQLFQTLSNFLLNSFNQASLGIYSKYDASDSKKAKVLYRLNIQLEHLAVTIPCLIIIPILGPFIELYGGEKYAQATSILQILILFSIPSKIIGGGTNSTVLLALNDFNFVLKLRVVLGILNIILNILLLYYYPNILSAVLGTNLVGVILGVIEYGRISKKGYENPFLSSVILITIGLIPAFVGYTLGVKSILEIILYCLGSFAFVVAAFTIFKPFDRFEHSINNSLFKAYEYISK